MLIYNINLIFIFICLYRSRYELEVNNDKRKYKILNIVAFACLWILPAMRYYTVGTDAEMYKNIFLKANSYNLANSPVEIGYIILNKILHFFNIGNGSQIIFIVTSFIILYLISKVIFKYSKKYELSFFLFITMYFYYNSFNQIRQYIAIAITFYAIKYIFEKDLKKYVICIAIAFLFHQSAIIMLPFYYILQINFSKKISGIIIGLGILGYLILDKVLLIVFSLIPRYQKYASGELSKLLTDGSNIVHALVLILLLAVIFILKDKLEEKDEKNKIYINAILFATTLQILGTRTVLFSRIVYYFSIYAILLIPNILDVVEEDKKRIVYISIMVIYFIHCIGLLVLNQSEVLPYIFAY